MNLTYFVSGAGEDVKGERDVRQAQDHRARGDQQPTGGQGDQGTVLGAKPLFCINFVRPFVPPVL